MSNIAYEREVKVFGIKEKSKVLEFLDRTYGRCSYDADITILKLNNNKKVKLIHEFDSDNIYLQYKTKLEGTDKVREENELFNVNEKESRRVLEFLGYAELYRGIKRRYKWALSETRNITYDQWLTGPLKGISFFEIETIDENDVVDFKDILNYMLVNSGIDTTKLDADIFTVNFGTLTLYNILNKLTKGNTLNFAMDKYHSKLLKQKGSSVVYTKSNRIRPEDDKWEFNTSTPLADSSLDNKLFTINIVSYKTLKETYITITNGDKKPKKYRSNRYYNQEEYLKGYAKELSKNKDQKSAIMSFIKANKFKLLKNQ